MSDTTVSILTPPGTGAIATVEVAGPRAWELARKLFQSANKKPLPEQPELNRFCFGTLADGDEVILAVKQVEPDVRLEVQCHGGRRVVQWVVEQFAADAACGFAGGTPAKPQAALMRAPTLRTASILLDQYHGAFDRAVTGILDHLDRGDLEAARTRLDELARFAFLGRHLIEPWKVVFAGEPNVGKSSLVNALAGFQRSVVSEIAGTTRDVISVRVAFDGWPFELIDTAGLRESTGLEAEGIERAKRVLASANLIVRVVDVNQPWSVWPMWGVDIAAMRKGMLVGTKADLVPHPSQAYLVQDGPIVSTVTGQGIPALIRTIIGAVIPRVPSPGTPVPYTPPLAELINGADIALTQGQVDDATKLLRAAIGRN